MRLPSLSEVIAEIEDPRSEWYVDSRVPQHSPQYMDYFDAVREWMVYESMALYWDAEHAMRPLAVNERRAYASVAALAFESRQRAAVRHWPLLALAAL